LETTQGKLLERKELSGSSLFGHYGEGSELWRTLSSKSGQWENKRAPREKKYTPMTSGTLGKLTGEETLDGLLRWRTLGVTRFSAMGQVQGADWEKKTFPQVSAQGHKNSLEKQKKRIEERGNSIMAGKDKELYSVCISSLRSWGIKKTKREKNCLGIGEKKAERTRHRNKGHSLTERRGK